MNLKIYSEDNCRLVRQGISTIRFQRAGCIGFSKAAVEAFSLKEKDRVLFAQDENNPRDWFVIKDSKTAGKSGFVLRKNSASAGLNCNCASVCKKLFESLKDKIVPNTKSIGFRLSVNPEINDGNEYYAIITSAVLK